MTLDFSHFEILCQEKKIDLRGVSTLLGQKNWFFLCCFIGQIYVPRILSKIFESKSVELEKLSIAEESAVESRRTPLSGETDSRRSRFLRWEILSQKDCLFLDNVFRGGDAKIYPSDFDHAIGGFAHRDTNTFKAFFPKPRFPNLRNSSRTRYMSNRDKIWQTRVSEVWKCLVPESTKNVGKLFFINTNVKKKSAKIGTLTLIAHNSFIF